MTDSQPADDDAVLIARTRAGDRDAFETLVRRHFRSAYLVALSVLGNRMDAEDTTQEAFLRALRALEECRDPARFRAWLLRITRNTARNARSARRVRTTFPLDDANELHDGALAADHVAHISTLGDRLEAAVATLSETQRTVLLMHDLEGYPHADIAAELEISEVSSRQHLFVARRLLRQYLGADAPGVFLHDR